MFVLKSWSCWRGGIKVLGVADVMKANILVVVDFMFQDDLAGHGGSDEGNSITGRNELSSD